MSLARGLAGGLVAAAMCMSALFLDGCSAVRQRGRTIPPGAREVIWHDPGRIGSLDLAWSDRARFAHPIPPFTFVKEKATGSRAKVTVRDAAGAKWTLKLAGNDDDTSEVHAEVAAGRLTWALGYFVERSYYVANGDVRDVGPLGRAARGLTSDGHFTAGCFKAPAPGEETVARWALDRNPFVGTKELSGLLILMTMVNNWDLGGTDNMKVLRVRNDEGHHEYRYLVSDMGASFGHMGWASLPRGWIMQRRWSKWKLADYQSQAFIDGVRDGMLQLHYKGEGKISGVPLDHARWFAGLVSQLTSRQIRNAFESAGGTPEEVDGFTTRFLQKVAELKAAVGER